MAQFSKNRRQAPGATAALIFAAALLAGLLPAISSTGKRAIAALQASARSGTGSQARTALRKSLLTIEIAATVVLLISAGLLLKSFWRLRTTDVGCVTETEGGVVSRFTVMPTPAEACELLALSVATA